MSSLEGNLLPILGTGFFITLDLFAVIFFQTYEAIDVYSFGHLLYEMCYGSQLQTATCDNFPTQCSPEISKVYFLLFPTLLHFQQPILNHKSFMQQTYCHTATTENNSFGL